MPALFAVTMFLSAALLFMVQPMVGKMVLPHVGGNPAVWNTCMVFFQALLLLGYWYAHKVTAIASQSKQVVVHVCVLTAAGAVLLLSALMTAEHSTVPILKSLAPEGGAMPFFAVVSMLAAAIGMPFLAVSTSAPLLQRWFTATAHPSARDPYFLYAASNAGSLISLLGYPLITEPTFRTVQQTWLWAGGFLILVGLSIQCGRAALNPLRPPAKPLPEGEAPAPVPEPGLGRKFRWLGRAFVPSSLMLGVTTHMTTDIASVPLLWVIPLALYLLTFIIAFARTPAWFRPVLTNAAPVAVLLLIFVMTAKYEILSTFHLLGLHLFAYFMLALLMHTEIADDRPDPRHLTGYFLWISFGGVLGGLFNAVVAPLLFPQAYEYPIAIALGCMLIPPGKNPPEEAPSVASRGKSLFLDLFIPIAMLAVCAGLYSLGKHPAFVTACGWVGESFRPVFDFIDMESISRRTIVYLAVFAPPCLFCFLFIDRPLRFGLCVAAILAIPNVREASKSYDPATGATRETIRSYFGIMRLEAYPQESVSTPSLYFDPLLRDADLDKVHGGQTFTIDFHLDTHEMSHGTTLHGRQFRSRYKVPLRRTDPTQRTQYEAHEYSVLPAFRDDIRALGVFSPWESIALLGAKEAWDPTQEPLTYYHRSGPVGAIFRESFARKALPRVGMVGLGTGSGAAYAIAGQSMTFYEIDSAVKAMIEEGRHFTYVTDARKRGAEVDIVMGDARLMLEKHAGPKYDLLLIDAFSSDSIPVHLLTVESVKLYRERLADHGLLALHVSNRYLRLEPVVAAIAAANGMACRIWADGDTVPPGKTESSWIVLAPSEKELGPTFVELNSTLIGAAVGFVGEWIPWKPWKIIDRYDQIPAWTDDFQDILRIVRSKELQRLRRWLRLPAPFAE